jgi:hypothetical protein
VPHRTSWQETIEHIRKVFERCLTYLGGAMRLDPRAELDLPYLHPRLSRVRTPPSREMLQLRTRAVRQRHRQLHSLGSTVESRRICVVGGRPPEGVKK